MSKSSYKRHMNIAKRNFFIDKLLEFGLENLSSKDREQVEIIRCGECWQRDLHYLYRLCDYHFLLD